MNNSEYIIQAKEVADIIDIAINSFRKNPPDEVSAWHIDHFVSTYLEFKDQALNPEPRFKNLRTLKQIKSQALTYFQEGSGKAVEEFWKQIAEKNIPLKKSHNKLGKILKRGKIKDQIEYDWIIDTYNSHSLSQDEVNEINNMIEKFESGK